jgi:hypothetical protein
VERIRRDGTFQAPEWLCRAGYSGDGDPAVRRQVAQLALDADKHQGDFINEALSLLFEEYGKPPIA